jgi:hypothetical protein
VEPRLASSWHKAFPMPEPAPVTIEILLLNGFILYITLTLPSPFDQRERVFYL